MIKKLLILIALVILGTVGYIFVTAFNEGRARATQFNQKTEAATKAVVESANQWTAAIKTGHTQYGGNYFVSPAFQNLTETTLASFKQAQQSLPPPPPTSAKVYQQDSEMRKFIAEQIQEMDSFIAASKAKQLTTIATLMKTHDKNIGDYIAKVSAAQRK